MKATEFLEARRQQYLSLNNQTRSTERTWVLRPGDSDAHEFARAKIVLKVDVYTDGKCESLSDLRPSLWVERVYFHSVQNLAELTPLEIEKIAQARRTIDAWLTGAIDSLPTAAPWE